MTFRLYILCTLLIAISACTPVNMQASPAQHSPEAKKLTVLCPEQRSQICTREYKPVCATRDTGVRCVTAPCPSSEQKTYSNGCSACADKSVLGYSPSACEKEPDIK